MANGKMIFGKQSGGTLGLVFPDGATHTEVTLPESGVIATKQYVDGKMVLGTAVNSTSGTSIDFTGIPSWVKRITVMFNGVSTSGVSPVQVQLGDAEGIESTGYKTVSIFLKAGASNTGSTYNTGFGLYQLNAASERYGKVIFTKYDNNTFKAMGFIYDVSDASHSSIVGSKVLSGVLDRIRITTVNGTDTFDAGSINIMYEG